MINLNSDLSEMEPASPLDSQHAESTQESLAETLMQKGSQALLRGEVTEATSYFDEAVKLNPMSAENLYFQGCAFFDYGAAKGRKKALLTACKKFKATTKLSPSFTAAWHAWGKALFQLGKTSDEYHYFQDAQKKYNTALELARAGKYKALPELYWHYGTARMRAASHSGEAVDIYHALEAFHHASSLEEQFPAEFWIDYGSAALSLAKQINDIRLHVKSMSCFKQAISISVNSFEGWSSLARALMELYSQTHDEDHFSQANECFTSAAQLRPEDTDLWLTWARFLLESGRLNQDIKHLRSSIEKCHRAYVCDPSIPLTCAIWGEALSLLGELSERLDLLYEAQNKITMAAELSSDDPEVLYSHGMCLTSFGRYFDDYDYFYQAIEKFQEGLSINRSCSMLWHGIAKSYASVGAMEGDEEALEKSLRFYSKALDLSPSTYYIFDYATALAKLGELTDEPTWIEQSVQQFERALGVQKNALYLHPDWLFHYACMLDLLGHHNEEDSYHGRAIEVLSHVLMIDPDFDGIHHRLGLAFSHVGELSGDNDQFQRAVHHFRLAYKRDEENDLILLDLALTLINIGQRTQDASEADQLYREAEHKLTQSAKLGNLQAYYHLGCLYSILGQYDKAMRFLQKAQEFESLPPLEEILSDDWLDGVRSTADFRAFLSELEKRA